MGRIAKVLSLFKGTRNGAKVSTVTADPGGGPNIGADQYSASGDDSQPLANDYALLVSNEQTGTEATAGYLDPNSSQKSASGEKRIYSRSAPGAEAAEVWLKKDGTILLDNGSATLTLSPDGSSSLTDGTAVVALDGAGGVSITNAVGSITMAASGLISLNGATIDPSGNIVSPGSVSGATLAAATSLVVAGKEMANHYHTQGPDSPSGDTQQNTSGPVGA